MMVVDQTSLLTPRLRSGEDDEHESEDEQPPPKFFNSQEDASL